MKCVFITAMVIYTITIQAVPCFYDKSSSYQWQSSEVMQCRKYEMSFGNTNRRSETWNTIHCTMRDIRRVQNVIQNDEIDRLRFRGPQVRINGLRFLEADSMAHRQVLG